MQMQSAVTSPRFLPRLAALLACLATMALAGCATSRSELALKTPRPNTAVVAAADAPVAVVASVRDLRQFEKAPKEASTPSLGFEGSDAASEAIKRRAIARKRNGFGKALGDVLLQDGTTVEQVVADTVRAALQEKGYAVMTADQAKASQRNPALALDVQVKTFWAWLQPGFTAIKVHTLMSVDIQSTQGAVINAQSATESSRAFVTDEAWLEEIERGVKALHGELLLKLPAAR